MKRITAVIIIFGFSLLLAACTNTSSVEDMLRAPVLTTDQLAVRDALREYAGEPITLKTPLAGERRASIQMIDLDGDGINEAAVFFTTSQLTTVQFGVLKLVDGVWQVSDVMNGLDTEVESVNFLSMAGGNGRLVLVHWSSPNSREHLLSPYRFENGQIAVGMEGRGTNLLVYDLNKDGYDEILYISQETVAGRAIFRLKYMKPSAEEKTSTSEVWLSPDMNDCLGLTAGLLADGTCAVFVDERIIRGDQTGDERYQQVTEVFVFDDGVFSHAESDFNIAELSRRSVSGLGCRRLYKDDYVYIPSSNSPLGVGTGDQWVYWYTINDGKAEYKAATYVDQTYNFALSVPDDWLNNVTVVHESDARTWKFYDKNGGLRLSLWVLTVGESVEQLESEDYQMLMQVGSYRFYVKGASGFGIDLDFIKNNFIVL